MKFYCGLLIGLLVIFSSCDQAPENGSDTTKEMDTPKSTTIHGEAQGTTYSVTYWETDRDFKAQIDSIFRVFDQDLSTYKEGSLINRLNAFSRRDTAFAFYDSTKNMSVVFEVAREVWRQTDGAFDPSVYPLVQAWGFGLENRQEMTQEKIDSIMQYTGFSPHEIDMIEVEKNRIYEVTWMRKGVPRTKIDFNALAQGYSADIVGDFLSMNGVENFMVEIGGEVNCRGKNAKGEFWKIGIDKPTDINRERELNAILTVENKAVATSGSYRNFYEKDGVRYSHTINPKTGYPVQHSLLSATVMATSCIKADAYATAFMVMGKDKTIQFLQDHPELELEAYLIYDENGRWETYTSEGMKKYLKEVG